MSAPALFAAAALAATLPAAALGWAMARIAEPLLRAPKPRGAMWSTALGLTVMAPIAAALWRFKPAAPVQAAPTMVVPATPMVAPVVATLVWRPDLTPWAEALLVVFAAGFVLNLVLLAIRLVQARRLARAARALSDPLLQAAVGRHADRLGLAAPPLLVSDTARTAMLVGVRQAAIVLPTALAQQTTPEALALICAHELLHLKRRDHWRALTDRLVAAAFWFNPFAIDILRRLVAVREEFCDQAVLSGADASERHLYAATLVEALRLAGSESLHPSFIRRRGGGHAMRLKAILHPAAHPRTAAMLAASGLLALAGTASLASGVALAQTAERASDNVSVATGRAPAAGRSTYLASIKLYDGSTLVASPRLVVQEGRPASIELGGAKGYKVKVALKPLGAHQDVIAIDATTLKDGAVTDVERPRVTMERGGNASVEVAGKISVDLTALNIGPLASGDTTERRLINPKYGNATAADLKRYCASADAGENGWCAGVIFGSLPAPGSLDGVKCSPSDMDNMQDADRRGRAAILAATPQPGQSLVAFARSTLAQIPVCKSEASLQINGAPAALADSRAVPSSRIDRVVVDFDAKKEALDGKPHVSTANLITKPDVTFQVIFSKAGERLGSPTVAGHFGQEVRIEIPNLMRVVALAQKPDQNGQSFTSAKMSIFQNNAWQPAKEMTMPAALTSTPSFEYSVEGTPYRFVVMPRLIVPAAG